MPMAFEFVAAAYRLRDTANAAAGCNDRIWNVGETHGLSGGGRLVQVIEQAIAASALNAAAVEQTCRAVADVCDARAEVCFRYAEARTNWMTAHNMWSGQQIAGAPPVGVEPIEPQRPYPWVEI